MKGLYPVFVFILMAALTIGCGEKIKPGEGDIERPLVKGVVIEETGLSDVPDFYEATGTLQAKNTAIVSSRIMGEVKEVKAIPGQRVKTGDVLLAIDAPELHARAEAAQQALEVARRGIDIAEEQKGLMETTFERYRILQEDKAVSQQEFDEIKAKKDVAVLEYEKAGRSLKRAEAELKEAEAYKEHTVITSPLDGVIAEKKIDRGSMTAPGMPLFIIEEPVYRIEVPVDEKMLPSINTGDSVSVSIDAIQLDTTGKIGEIVRQIDPFTRTFMVKIDLNERSRLLQGGFYAKAKFSRGRKTGVFIPREAIITRGDLIGVYVVSEDGIVTFRLLRTGKVSEGKIEVLSGLNPGEKIIVRGTERAIDGGKIGDNDRDS